MAEGSGILGVDDANDVFESCKVLSAKWDIIGLKLGLSQLTLGIIKRDNPGDSMLCMMSMLNHWLKRESDKQPIPTWEALCLGLTDVDRVIAQQIAQKHGCRLEASIYAKKRDPDSPPDSPDPKRLKFVDDDDRVSSDSGSPLCSWDLPPVLLSGQLLTKEKEEEKYTKLLQEKEEELFAAMEREKVLNELLLTQSQELESLKKSYVSAQQSTESTFHEAQKSEDQCDTEHTQGLSTSIIEDKKQDAEVQFDYWVPLEDLLHGATVVDATVFNTHGDKEQEYHWNECGFSLVIPEGALSPIETSPVAVKAIISGRFQFPEGFRLISALYAISPGRKFTKDVKIVLQHCFLIERTEQLKRLCFVKAHSTGSKSLYVFQTIEGGAFKAGSQYCEIWMSDFSIIAAGVLADTADDDGSGGSQAGSSSNEGDTGSDDDQAAASNGQEGELEKADNDQVASHGQEGELEQAGDHSESPNTPESPRVPSNVQSVHKDENPMSKEGNVSDIQVQPTAERDACASSLNLSSHEKGDTQLYRAHFFLQSSSSNCWEFKLVAVKHLDVHIKYVNDKCKDDRHIESFKFRFILSKSGAEEPAIILLFAEEENKQLPSGWFVKPHSSPCCIPQEEIESLTTKDLTVSQSDIPMRKASIFAEDGAASHMQYGVQVEGIREKKKLFIVLQLNSAVCSQASPRQLSVLETNMEVKSSSKECDGIDVNVVKKCIIGVVEENFAALKRLSEDSIGDLAAEMFSKKLITRQVHREPSFMGIINCFKAGFEMKRELSKVKEHCNKFFSALYEIGGQFDDAAEILKDSINKKLKEELKCSFNVLS